MFEISYLVYPNHILLKQSKQTERRPICLPSRLLCSTDSSTFLVTRFLYYFLFVKYVPTSVRCLMGSPVIFISSMRNVYHAFQLEFIKFEWDTFPSHIDLCFTCTCMHGYTGE